MNKIRIAVIFAILLVIGINVKGQTPSFYERFSFLNASSSVFQEGALGMANPANLYFLKNPEFQVNLTIKREGNRDLKNWSFVSGVHGLGFGMIHRRSEDYNYNQYQVSLAFGSDGDAFGIGYSWFDSEEDRAGFEKELTLSVITRPERIISLGLIHRMSLESRWNETVGEAGLRPFGNQFLTLFGDIIISRGTRIWDSPKSFGFILEPKRGINLIGRFFKDKSFTFGINICLGNVSIKAQPHVISKHLESNTVSFRFGGKRPSYIDERVNRNKKYFLLNLKGTVGYNKYAFFDNSTQRFMDILTDIRAAVDDPRIAALVLNLSGMRIYPEFAWEIREELNRAKENNKQVIVFIDEVGMTHYFLASVADKIVLDPAGSIRLSGIAMSRTYLKGTLEKLGLGFDPWRFNKYKSAPETYSHNEMSETDREQNQDYIDDRYELVRKNISAARGISTDEFDRLVDEVTYITPNKAIETKLADTLGRWSDRAKIIKNLIGSQLGSISGKKLLGNTLPQSDWGVRDKIVVVYGLGDCEMDRGIRARWLERLFLSLAHNKKVRAVVFRVDSPGGLTMPSDLVAQAVKRCAAEKPLVVSQGQMAASGGYMISTYADSILAGPNTVTGSIGIYGGWVYDKGIGDKIGMNSDYVSRGAHADLTTGIRLPYIGLNIPSRNLTSDEYDRMNIILHELYDDFVTQVSVGRKIDIDSVKKIAEGRIYSGIDGKEIGLVDKIGGLMDAIEMAKNMAGIKTDEPVDIIEIPKSKGWFDLRKKLYPLGISMEDEPVYNYLRMLSENRMFPLPMLEPGICPEME